jgi:hypothetical protein
VTGAPYDWGQARDAINAAKAAQANAEAQVREAFKAWGAAERAYRMALAQEITNLRAAGQPVTVVQDLAKGAEHIANLRYRRDIAEGVKEAALSAQWRHTADRRALDELVDWSKRRDLAEGYHGAAEPQWTQRKESA